MCAIESGLRGCIGIWVAGSVPAEIGWFSPARSYTGYFLTEAMTTPPILSSRDG